MKHRANPTIKAHYQDWEWEELKEKVDEAHLEVLEEYKAKELLKALNLKAKFLISTKFISNRILIVNFF
mgnify:CR=1 FL=1